MPRPRILCSPRSKAHNTVENVKPQPRVVTISESEEPDCEIIKIEDGNNEKKKISLQVRGVAQLQYRGSQCLPSMLSLQFLPSTASNITGNAGGQNVVMVLPVDSSQSQVFNPTLCTLEKIENPNEISEIKQVVGIGEKLESSVENICTSDEKKLENTRKNIAQSVFTHISTEKQRQISKQRFSDPMNETIQKKVDMENDDCVLQQPSTSFSNLYDRRLPVVEIKSDVSSETVDCIERAETSNLRPKEFKDNAAGHENKISKNVKFSDTSGASTNREDLNFAAKKINYKSNNLKILNPRISLSKIKIDRKSLIRNGTTASLIRKKVAGNVNSSVEDKTATSVAKRSLANQKTATVMQKAADHANSLAKSEQSMLQSKGLENSYNSHEYLFPATESIEKIEIEENFPIASQSIASGMTNREAGLLWNLNCIVCGGKFTDRTKLHRHATLAHPDVQILFCEFCNDSFLTHEKLKAHRVKSCKSEITEILETIVIEDEEDDPLPSEEISENMANEPLETGNIKINKAPESQKLKTRSCSAGILVRKKRGRPRKNFANFVVTHKYVEEEVMNHAVGAKKKELVTAEIKKLIVPIARLEDSTLKKYLGKRTKSPLSDYRDEDESLRKNFRKKKRGRPRRKYSNVGKLKRPRKSSNTMLELKKLKTNLRCAQEMKNDTFLRRTDKIMTRNSLKRTCTEKSAVAKNRGKIVGAKAKKRPIYTDTDDNSDDSGSKFIPVVDKDSGINKRSIIRKLPSRSSAESFVCLKTGVKIRQRSPEKTYGEWILRNQKIVDCSDCVETSVKKHTEPESCRIPSNRSNIKTVNNDKHVDHVELEKVSKDPEENGQQNAEKTSSSKESVPQKTYLPSKRKALSATKLKQQCDPMSGDLCLMCKELLELMKQLAHHFEGNKANKISVKCPLCNHYFISMFYLKKHVSRFHLLCQKRFPSQLSKSLMLLKSANDENFDCETEIVPSLECQHCSDKFSKETNLVDHIFTQHNPSIFYEDTATDFPYYVDDLPNSYFQTKHVNSTESSSKNLSSKTVNRPFVKRNMCSLTSKSVDDKDTNNLTSKSVESINRATKLSQVSKSRIESVRPSNLSQSTKISTESPNNSAGEEFTSLRTETQKYCSEETPSTSISTQEDQATSDREYLLKQLLSDDSCDSFEYPKPAPSRHIQKVPKFSRKITVESEREFTRRQCHICDKQFGKTQDLLIHSLEHDSPDVKGEESPSNVMPDAIDNSFADSIEYGWFNEEFVTPKALESQTEESETTTPILQQTADDLDTSDVLFCSGDENNDFSLVFKHSDEPEIETDSENRKSVSLSSKSSSQTNEKPENLRAKESHVGKRASKLISEDTEPQTKKLKVLQELLETEKGLVNPDETDLTRKIPIECSKCNRKFPNQASLNEHLFFLHDDSLKTTVLTDVVSPISRPEDNSKEPRQWRCDECHHNFKLLQSYGRHRYFVHGDDEMVHVCENCCKVMTTVTMVNVHICTDVASYNCRTCNETFSTGMSLRLHNMYKHKETEGPHNCVPCNKKFLTNAMLKRHEQWEHRFMRPYRPRKSSPVHMATPDAVPSKYDDHSVKKEIDRDCDQEYVDMEYEFTGNETAKGRKRDFRSLEVSPQKRRSQETNTAKQKSRHSPKDALKESSLVTYIGEEEIIQCNLCRLYCLSMAILRTHMANSHSIMGEVCRICEKMYSKGKLVRHMIDQHINPCETYTEDKESIWNVGMNVEEKDAEELIRMLGMSRFISLCEYQRFSDSTDNGAVSCPNCAEELESCESYKLHFFMKHDIMCALCNIEFKSGDKAAIHKTEDHGSVDSYIWFADQTVGALTAATNFSEAAEKSFIEMISRDSDEAYDENEDEDCGDEDQSSTEYFEAEIDDGCRGEEKTDGKESLSEFLEENHDQKLMIVVTDDDLRYYGIGTRNPNIWGLASKISSTSTELTPKDVKVMLDSYFGK